LAEICEDQVQEEDYVLVVAEEGLVMRAPGEQPVEEEAEERESRYERGQAANSYADEAPADCWWQWVDAVWRCEISGVDYAAVGFEGSIWCRHFDGRDVLLL
jgi:hypothetical protein